jgi:hypothetical protein
VQIMQIMQIVQAATYRRFKLAVVAYGGYCSLY